MSCSLNLYIMYLCLSGMPCVDKDGVSIKEGDSFFPNKSNVCQNCQCMSGKPVNCAMIYCDAPPCPYYELIEGTCCGFKCLDGPPIPEPGKILVAPRSNHIARMHVTIPISAAMAPKAKVMVYYVREDMETVATSREFKVQKCFDNKVRSFEVG